jgi:hypothetical protein
MRKTTIILLAISMLVVAVTACGGGGSGDRNLHGTWEAGSSRNRPLASSSGEWIIEFSSDGTFKETLGAWVLRGTWETRGGSLTMTIPAEGDVITYDYNISGSTLTLTARGDSTTFTRQRGGSSSSGSGNNNNQGSSGSANEDELEFTFRFDPDTNGVMVTGYTGSSLEITVPSQIDGQPVTSITGFGTWGGMTINLPNTLVEIGDSAFVGNQSLSTVVIPESVTRIGAQAFRSSAISSIQLPSNLEIIGIQAFEGADKLTSIVIPNSVTEIESGAFAGTALTSIVIPDMVTEIGSHAFAGTALTSIVIPDSVRIIGEGAFYNVDLTSIVIGSGVIEIGRGAFFNNTSFGGGSVPPPPPGETVSEQDLFEGMIRDRYTDESLIQAVLKIYDIGGLRAFWRSDVRG